MPTWAELTNTVGIPEFLLILGTTILIVFYNDGARLRRWFARKEKG